MAQKIYGLVCDGGDGSTSMHWFRDEEKVNDLLENDTDLYMNEGSHVEVLTFPVDLDLTACGFSFRG